MVILNRWDGSFNTLDDLSSRICVPNKKEDVNINVVKMIIRRRESETLTKHILCDCKCICDGRKSNSNQKWNKTKCFCESKNPMKHCSSKENYIWSACTCAYEIDKY